MRGGPLVLFLLVGPPGTGKTTVAASILKGWSTGLDGDNQSPIFAGTGTIAALNALRTRLDALGTRQIAENPFFSGRFVLSVLLLRHRHSAGTSRVLSAAVAALECSNPKR